MKGFQFNSDAFLLIISVFLIYLMSPLIGYRYEVGVSAIFGLLLIFSSCPRRSLKHMIKYAAFLILIILARHSLCCWQPWIVLFDHGLYESSALPPMIVSLAVSLSGWLLLNDWNKRLRYLVITFGIQLILYAALINDLVDPSIVRLPHIFLQPEYPGIWEAWQFEWMMVYYLSIYFLSRLGRKGQAAESKKVEMDTT